MPNSFEKELEAQHKTTHASPDAWGNGGRQAQSRSLVTAGESPEEVQPGSAGESASAFAMLKFTLASTSTNEMPWSAQAAAHRCRTCTALGWRWLAITWCNHASAWAIA
jgi:hypothetical protein